MVARAARIQVRAARHIGDEGLIGLALEPAEPVIEMGKRSTSESIGRDSYRAVSNAVGIGSAATADNVVTPRRRSTPSAIHFFEEATRGRNPSPQYPRLRGTRNRRPSSSRRADLAQGAAQPGKIRR